MKEVKVLGPGCAKCKKLADNVKEALASTQTDANFEYITDIQKIMEHGIMMTPGLIIDGKIESTGKVLSVKDIIQLINS